MDAFRTSTLRTGPGLCPRCETRELEWKFADRFRLGSCSQCHGNWLAGVDMMDLWLASDATLRKLAAHDQDPLSVARRLPSPCPDCRRTMRRHMSKRGYCYDVCDQHGLWFDCGELGQIVADATAPATGFWARLSRLARRFRHT